MANEISIEQISAELDADRSIWTAAGDLCCRTGDGGDPIPTERWELFARIWIEPYRVLMPEWSYVALADRRVVGYLTGCPDTARLARRCFVRCTAPLLWQIAFGRHRGDAYGKRFARQSLRLENSAERSYPKPIRRRLVRQFPAHLHMNVDAEFHRGGVGRRLIERFIQDLRQRRVSGVHLFCGAAPVSFYTRGEFHELAVISPAAKTPPSGSTPGTAGKAEPAEEDLYANPALAAAREALERGEFALALTTSTDFSVKTRATAKLRICAARCLLQQGRTLMEQNKLVDAYSAANQLVKSYPKDSAATSLLTQVRGRLV